MNYLISFVSFGKSFKKNGGVILNNRHNQSPNKGDTDDNLLKKLTFYFIYLRPRNSWQKRCIK